MPPRKKKRYADAMEYMAQRDAPLPGQAMMGAPDVDPKAGRFQQAFRSMIATPDEYYRWERDQRIAEQDAKKRIPPEPRSLPDPDPEIARRMFERSQDVGNLSAAEQDFAKRMNTGASYAGAHASNWFEKLPQWKTMSEEDRLELMRDARELQDEDIEESIADDTYSQDLQYSPSEARTMSTEVLASPEDYGIDPGWGGGIDNLIASEWGPEYLKDQFQANPNIWEDIKTEDFWDRAAAWVSKRST